MRLQFRAPKLATNRLRIASSSGDHGPFTLSPFFFPSSPSPAPLKSSIPAPSFSIADFLIDQGICRYQLKWDKNNHI
ncbi:hypothetical protein Hanom_Chr10g00899661 [Helianthus anomalus]